MIISWSTEEFPNLTDQFDGPPARIGESRAWPVQDTDFHVETLARRLRAVVRDRLGESLPTDGFINLGGELVLWVHGFRFKLTERGDTLISGRLYPQAVRMDVTHPRLGIHVDAWRPGRWLGRIFAGLD